MIDHAFDASFLSRIQFAFTIGFHILFPTLNIGLAIFLAIIEGLYLYTKKEVYAKALLFWIKIFALTFGMGLVSGIVMSYELGTNFPHFTYKAGEILGVLFGYEVLSAFFLEAGFLGVMLFGWKKVPLRVHYIATLMVAIGVSISAFWILSANSWMQYPTGYKMVGDKMVDENWMEIIFNPTFLPRFFHMTVASYITSAFVIAGVSAYLLLRKKSVDVAKFCMSFALWTIVISVPLQMIIGDTVGRDVFNYQPIKTASIEGVWDTQKGAPLLLFAIPDQEKQENKYTISVPHLASLLNTHSWDGELVGLKTVAKADQPKVAIVFFSFRIMVGIGVLMLFIMLWHLVLRYKGRLFDTKIFLKSLLFMAPLGFIATVSGWITAEVGRQPWVIYNVLRTKDAAAKIDPDFIFFTLSLMFVVYLTIFIFYLYYLSRMIKDGPPDNIDVIHTQNIFLKQGE